MRAFLSARATTAVIQPAHLFSGTERVSLHPLVEQTHHPTTEDRTMITEYVLFALPPGMTRAEVVAGMHEVAPRWRGEPELIRKTFVYDPAAGQAGAFYLWKNRRAAEAAHDAAWRQRIRAAYGSEPTIRFFETPLVVDNALGAVIGEQ